MQKVNSVESAKSHQFKTDTENVRFDDNNKKQNLSVQLQLL